MGNVCICLCRCLWLWFAYTCVEWDLKPLALYFFVGGVRQWGNQLEPHRVCWQPGGTGHDCNEAPEYLCSRWWGVQVSSGNWLHSAVKVEQPSRQEQELSQTKVGHQPAVWNKSLCWRRLLWHQRWATISRVRYLFSVHLCIWLCVFVCFVDWFIYSLSMLLHHWLSIQPAKKPTYSKCRKNASWTKTDWVRDLFIHSVREDWVTCGIYFSPHFNLTAFCVIESLMNWFGWLIGAGFLEKNRDTLSADLLQVIQASSFKFVTGMFKEDFSAVCKNYFFYLSQIRRHKLAPMPDFFMEFRIRIWCQKNTVLCHHGKGGAMLTPNKLVFTFRGFYVCANFGENRSGNAMWVCAQMDRQ